MENKERILNLIEKYSVPTPNGCQEWQGVKNNRGYGMISLMVIPGRKGKRTTISAHRAHYMAYYNTALDDKTVIRHFCDNPACVKITHLFTGTHKDNTQDCVKRGRRAKTYKPHLRTRIHPDQVIRSIRLSIGPLKDVAVKYGVSISYVSKIRNGKAKVLNF